jgi:peptidyl-prolyl cis-trans isomerase SurA
MAAASLLVLSYVVFTSASAQQAGDGVTDEQITEREIEQRSKFDHLARHKDLSRQEVIDELRNDKKKIRDAQDAGIDVSDAEVDAQYASIGARMHMTVEQLTEQLAHAGVDADTLKQQLRASLAARALQLAHTGRARPGGQRE